jgi:hypothetical protein
MKPVKLKKRQKMIFLDHSVNHRFKSMTPSPSRSIENICRNSRGVSFEKDKLDQIVGLCSFTV